VNAVILIEADDYDSFSDAFSAGDFDDIEIVNITEPER
jgi:hypothetical protein